jgi:hypothetical protein
MRGIGRSRKNLLGFTCILLLLGILYAGLKPFHAPHNGVEWARGAGGLKFNHHGVVFSADSLPPSPTGRRSVEFWVSPGRIEDSSTIATFYDPASRTALSLHQSISDLELRIAPSSAWYRNRISRLYVSGAFRERRSSFWAITSGPGETTIYRDGARIASTANFPISAREFAGRIVFGTSPRFDSSWSGTLKGLAIYDRELMPEHIGRHQRTWTDSGSPRLETEDDCVALYVFDERAGSFVHNRAARGAGLVIPAKYLILTPTVLDPVWRAFRWSRSFWTDALVNVGGFIPFGFFYSSYFSARGVRRPLLTAAMFGIVISLIIELVQTRLPTRDSSMSDLIANSLGTLLGTLPNARAVPRSQPHSSS